MKVRNTEKLTRYLDVLDYRTVYGKVTVTRRSNNACHNRVDRDISFGMVNCYGLDRHGVNHPPHLARRLEKEWSPNSIPTPHRQSRL